MGTSKRLSNEDKIRFLELLGDNEENRELAQHILSPEDSKEFHEGMVAGMLLAIEIFAKNRALESAIATQKSAKTLDACFQACIQETMREQGEN